MEEEQSINHLLDSNQEVEVVLETKGLLNEISSISNHKKSGKDSLCLV